MFISVNPSSGEPVYRQVMRQIRERIVSGQLARGEKLPSVRDLSAEAGINPLTVAKVYQFLEREGFVETRRGHGTFVAVKAPTLSPVARREELAPALRQLVAEALHLGLSETELLQLVSETLRNLQPPQNDE
jgi:GntR family transcriptional regulator